MHIESETFNLLLCAKICNKYGNVSHTCQTLHAYLNLIFASHVQKANGPLIRHFS